MFHLMCVQSVVSSGLVAGWPSFGREMPTRLTLCSLCIMSICNFGCFPFLVLRSGFGF